LEQLIKCVLLKIDLWELVFISIQDIANLKATLEANGKFGSKEAIVWCQITKLQPNGKFNSK